MRIKLGNFWFKFKKVKKPLKPKEIAKKLDNILETLEGAKCQLSFKQPNENGLECPRHYVVKSKIMIENLMEELGVKWD